MNCHKKHFQLFLLLFLPTICFSQNYNAMAWKEATAYNAYLMRDVHQQFSDRRENLEKACASKKAMLNYRDDCRQRYLRILGDFPVKSDLNAKVTGSVQSDGFRIENILFESMPGRYVTANLYIPDGTGPFPATLELCGHGLNGKVPVSNSALQMVANGIAVMVVDPVGQGERLQLIDKNGAPLTRGVTTEHTLLNAGCNLVGTSIAAIEVWDNHRAIDYLLTRKDINPQKIGAYGSSGGGTQTAYLIGYDDRIQVAGICSYFSQRERVLELPGPSDGCQHIPGEGLKQIEIADFALMMAPKPVLILSGKYDFVDLWGAQQGFKELKKAYTTLGVPEKVDMITVETGHGLGKEKLQRLVGFFKSELAGDFSPVKNVDYVFVEKERMLITTSGQVNLGIAGAKSLPEQNAETIDAYATNREKYMQQDESAIKDKVLELLGIQMPASEIKIVPTGTIPGRDCEMFKYQIVRDGEMPVACVAIIPDIVEESSPVVVYLNENGKEEFLKQYEQTAPFVAAGTIVVAADLRGLGETVDLPANNDPKYWNKEYRYSMVSMHIGRPIMGQRVVDLISLLDFISAQPQMKGRPVNVVANGIYGPVTIHAAFLDKRIQSAEISRSLKSFTDYVQNPMQHDMYSNVLFGVLKYYDLKDLIRKAGIKVVFKD